MLRPSSEAICGDRVPCPYRTPDSAFAIASIGRIAIIEPPFRGGAPMANVPGVVTDPSRIKGGVVSLTSGGAQIPAYMARPHQPGNYPGIVVIQEAFGLVDHICDLARRFANIGYNACAPALYWRRGAPKDPDIMEQVFPVMFGLPDNEALQDLNAAADHLRGMPGATGKVGAIGFCSGGRHTLLFACSSGKVDAAVDFLGGFIHRADPDQESNVAPTKPPLDMFGLLHCPLLGVLRARCHIP